MLGRPAGPKANTTITSPDDLIAHSSRSSRKSGSVACVPPSLPAPSVHDF